MEELSELPSTHVVHHRGLEIDEHAFLCTRFREGIVCFTGRVTSAHNVVNGAVFSLEIRRPPPPPPRSLHLHDESAVRWCNGSLHTSLQKWALRGAYIALVQDPPVVPLRRSSLQVLDPSPRTDASRAVSRFRAVLPQLLEWMPTLSIRTPDPFQVHRRALLHCAHALDGGSGAASFPRLVVASVIILELFFHRVRSCGQGIRQGSSLTSNTLDSADRLPRATRGPSPHPVPWVDCRCHCSGPLGQDSLLGPSPEAGGRLHWMSMYVTCIQPCSKKHVLRGVALWLIQLLELVCTLSLVYLVV